MTINITALAEIVITQLTSIHANIMTREEGKQYPTLQEVNMEVRLINSLDKLRKLAIFFAKQPVAEPAAAPAQPASSSPAGPVFETNIPESRHGIGDPPPINAQELDQYSHLLTNYADLPADSTIEFRGKTVSRWWLMYNLFQLCKDKGWCYIQDEQRFRHTVDLNKLRRDMDMYFLGRAA
jgi:hypothetical protein